MEDGKKSLAIEVTLKPRDKTLTDEDISAVSNVTLQGRLLDVVPGIFLITPLRKRSV